MKFPISNSGPPLSSLQYMWAAAKTLAMPLVLVTLLLLLVSALMLANPWFAGQLAGNLTEQSTGHWPLSQLLPGWMVVLVLQSLMSFIARWRASVVGDSLRGAIWLRLHQKLLSLPLNQVESRRRGKLLSLFSNDVYVVSNFIASTLTNILPQVLTFIGALVLLALMDIRIASLALIIVVLFVFVIKKMGHRVRPLAAEIMEDNSRLMSRLEETVTLMPVLKAFVLERKTDREFDELIDEYKAHRRDYHQKQLMIAPVVQTLGGLAVLCVVWYLSYQVKTDELQLEQLVSLLFYGFLLMRPVSTLAGVYGQLQAAQAGAQRLIEIESLPNEESGLFDNNLARPAAVASSQTQQVNQKSPPAINFQNVSFAYDETRPVLNNFRLDIDAGETVALAGRNGAGKSTIAKLLLRFEQPDSGLILCDGFDIGSLDLAMYRSRIGYVPQTNQLFHGTVRSNLSLSLGQPSDEALLDALSLIGESRLLDDLPYGLDTVVGEQGVTLSGGQCQRIALARALVHKPDLLILDEATSMFDTEAEAKYILACRQYLQGVTVVLITHRTASLALADRAIDLDAC